MAGQNDRRKIKGLTLYWLARKNEDGQWEETILIDDSKRI
jgi:hypothetical protein